MIRKEKTRAAGVVMLGAGLVAVGLLSGCRVERTRGQRHQARAIESMLLVESQRLATQPANEQTVDEYRHLLGMYQELFDSTLRSAWAQPTQVQQAEDQLLNLADEVRGLDSYLAMHPDTQVNFERQFWRNRLQPWEQWRGPGWQTNREQWEEELKLNY